jgi:hypothetical protein
MSKKTVTTSTSTTAAPLDPTWLEASADDARGAVDRAGAAAESLVEAWIERRNAAAVAAVAADERAPAAARKAARRGINVLKSRGVAIPERRVVARVGTTPEADEFEAWLLPPDATGTEIFLIASRSSSSRTRIVEAVVRDRVGLLQIRANELNRSQLRSYFDQIQSQLGMEPATIPVGWARAMVARAREENAKSGAIVPLGLDQNADLLGPVPAEPPKHPVDESGIEPAEPVAAAARSRTLHAEPEFRSWIPDDPAINDLLFSLGEKVGPNPQAEGIDFNALARDAVAEATDRFFTPEVRESLVRRMKEAAVSILARGARDRVADVLGTIRAIESAGLVTSPPREIPFLTSFFDKALALLSARAGGRLRVPVPAAPEPLQGSPIVTPDNLASEAAERAAAAGERVSSGGIILP